MKAGIGVAQAQAGRILGKHPLAWLSAVIFHAPLLLSWAALALTVLSPSNLAALGEVERGRLASLAGLAVAILLLWHMAYEACYLALADKLLRDDVAGWSDFFGGVRRYAPRLLAGRLVLLAARAVAFVLSLGLLLWLLSGGDLAVLRRALSGDGGLRLVVEAWRGRGIAWVVGVVALAAAASAMGSMVRMGGTFWRIALVVDQPPLLDAPQRSLLFVLGQGWMLLGRSLWGFATILAAVLTPTILAGLAGSGLAGLRAVDREAARVANILLVALWIGGVAVSVALAKAYLTLGDLALYRLRGGAAADRALLTRGVRPRPRPVRRAVYQPPVDLLVASEPAGPGGRWRPSAVAGDAPPFAPPGRPAGDDDMPTL